MQKNGKSSFARNFPTLPTESLERMERQILSRLDHLIKASLNSVVILAKISDSLKDEDPKDLMTLKEALDVFPSFYKTNIESFQLIDSILSRILSNRERELLEALRSLDPEDREKATKEILERLKVLGGGSNA